MWSEEGLVAGLLVFVFVFVFEFEWLFVFEWLLAKALKGVNASSER